MENTKRYAEALRQVRESLGQRDETAHLIKHTPATLLWVTATNPHITMRERNLLSVISLLTCSCNGSDSPSRSFGDNTCPQHGVSESQEIARKRAEGVIL